MKALFVVCDGMADRPVRELGRRTPLQVAETPNMDALAGRGITGIVDPVAPGVPPGSDVANMALLGYDPYEHYTGRGGLEALGAGLDLGPGDVAFRCNFATVGPSGLIMDRRAGRIRSEHAAELAEALGPVARDVGSKFNVVVELVPTVEHRAVVVLRGEGLSRAVSDTDPGEVGRPIVECRPLDNSPEARRTAEIVNALSRAFREALEAHPLNKELPKPANAILFRGAGIRPRLRTLGELYGIRGSCISAVPLVRGVCRAVGLRPLDVPGATGSYDTDLHAKFSWAVRELEGGADFVFLHVKATDLASHDHAVGKKVELIERIDEALGHALGALDLDSDTYVLITADHTTSLRTGKHEGDPVPVVLAGPEVRPDGVEKFDEVSCATGGLGRLRGKDLMPILMNLLGRVGKFGF